MLDWLQQRESAEAGENYVGSKPPFAMSSFPSTRATVLRFNESLASESAKPLLVLCFADMPSTIFFHLLPEGRGLLAGSEYFRRRVRRS